MPIFGGNFNIVLNKGCFGCRIDCGEKLGFQGVKAHDLSNTGGPGFELSEIPDGNQFPNLVQSRYIGNDVWGFEFASAKDYKIQCAEAYKSTASMEPLSLALNYEDSTRVSTCQTIGLTIFRGRRMTLDRSSILPYRLWIPYYRLPEPNKILDSQAHDIVAPRESVGFAVESQTQVSVDQYIQGCTSWNLVCNSSNDLSNLEYPKSANGFETAETSTRHSRTASPNRSPLQENKQRRLPLLRWQLDLLC